MAQFLATLRKTNSLELCSSRIKRKMATKTTFMWLFSPLYILNFNPFTGDNLPNYDDGKRIVGSGVKRPCFQIWCFCRSLGQSWEMYLTSLNILLYTEDGTSQTGKISTKPLICIGKTKSKPLSGCFLREGMNILW